MSIYSDYECGAMDDIEFHNACVEENARDRWEREHDGYCQNDFDNDECIECSSYDDCLRELEENK